MNQPDDGNTATEIFERHRRLLVGIAYQVVGEINEAEDVVQDAWLRWSNVPPGTVDDPRAYLVQTCTRLAIDYLRRAKTRRETYVGPWLPEPLVSERDALADIELAESVSMAMLVVLETLSPLERAVFVLREAFGLPYGEIADVIDRSEDAVRQLGRRARAHVQQRSMRFESSDAERREVTERFLTATSSGDVEQLLAILAPDVTLVADAGGIAGVPRRPVHGARRVVRLMRRGIASVPELRMSPTDLNGQPGLIITSGSTLVSALILEVAGGMVQRIYLVANPDKLPPPDGTTRPRVRGR